MTRTTNARIAGVTFLVYIAVGISSMVLFSQAAGGEDIAARLASIAQNATEVRITILLGLLMSFSALVLGVTLYAITREQDPDLAMLAMTCRFAEGIIGAGLLTTLGLLWLATATGVHAPDTGAAHALATLFLKMGAWDPSAVFFAVGSTLFSWLLLRGRLVPVALAWLGVVASVLLVVVLPLQLAGLLGGPSNWLGMITWLIWMPMLVFELVLALWLIIKGVTRKDQ
jgi:hypothetical protein